MCPVSTEMIADMIRTVTTHKWKVSRIINNKTHIPDKAVCLVYYDSYDYNMWARVEIFPNGSGITYYYVVDEYNFVYDKFTTEFNVLAEMTEELCLFTSENFEEDT